MILYTFSKDTNGRFSACNEAFAALVDADSPQQVIGKNDHDMPWREQFELFRMDDISVMRGNTLYNKVEQQIRAAYIAQVMVSKSPLLNEDNLAVGLSGSFVDMDGFFIQPINGAFEASGKRFYFTLDGTTVYFTLGEYRIFRALLQGKSNQQIAVELNRSKRTIESVVLNIARKLQCTTKLQIVHMAMTHGLTHVLFADDL